MYVVQHFAEERDSVMRAYLSENPFAALVVQTAGGLSVDHIPLEFESSYGPKGCLLGHIARSNPLWREFESGPGMAVFSGHHAYVSPDWYASKAADPRVVPTWNYAAVHVSGTLRFFHDVDRIREILERLTNRFESARPGPWRMTDAPPEFISQLAGASRGRDGGATSRGFCGRPGPGRSHGGSGARGKLIDRLARHAPVDISRSEDEGSSQCRLMAAREVWTVLRASGSPTTRSSSVPMIGSLLVSESSAVNSISDAAISRSV